ncbi:transposase, partial [Nocardia farcinica]|uniref:transposase n=1 Tax=Nocardia farcinica TaxID=37329 RepID=UPI001E2981D1
PGAAHTNDPTICRRGDCKRSTRQNRSNSNFAPDTAWTTEYYGLATEQMRRAGRRIDDEVLTHISPAHSENINFFGAIEVDIDAELAQLGPTGYRPLRVRDTLF